MRYDAGPMRNPIPTMRSKVASSSASVENLLRPFSKIKADKIPTDRSQNEGSEMFRISGRGQLKCDGTRAETRFRLSAKRTSPFKSAGASVQSTTGSRGVRISGSNAGYTMFRGSVKGTAYPLHSSVSPLHFPLYVTVCRHISTGVYR